MPHTHDYSQLSFGTVGRVSLSRLVQKNFCTLNQANLMQLCNVHYIDSDRFGPILHPPGQSVYDPPEGYDAIYEEYFKIA